MKKLLTLLLSAIVLAFSVFAVGCSQAPGNPPQNPSDFNIYTPDGAPALALSKLMVENETLGVDAKYNVVNATNIRDYIVNGSADIAILPITAASKLCGTGTNYKMIASVTNGNLFVIGKGTGTTLADLVGKKVAVANLADFPGIAFRALLNNNDIEFTTINDTDSAVSGKVSLVGIAGNAVKASLDAYDYVVAPQPVATVAVNSTAGASVLMDIQQLWGGNMVQAVAVVKNTHYNNTTLIHKFLKAVAKTTNSWLLENKTDAVNAINANFVGGASSTLNANTLNAQSIAGSNIKVVTAISADFGANDNYTILSKSHLETAVNNIINSFAALNLTPSPVDTNISGLLW